MRLRRLAPGLVALTALVPSAAAATTAATLSDRIFIDGHLGDYAADEWVLDASTAFPERAGDSRWGTDNDAARVAVSWDHARLYLAVDFTAAASGVLVMIANGPGGVASLDATGEFRRALDLPFAANLLLLASPGSQPRVARADATHSFALVDRATIPAAIAATPGGAAGFEAWIPWTVLDPSRPLRIVVVMTGDTGSGAGDVAPDTRTALTSDRYARAVVDRWFVFTADADADGVPDDGVAPRAVTVVEPDDAPAAAAGDADVDVSVEPAAFAPDRGESATFTIRTAAGELEDVSGRCIIFGMDGREVRTIAIAPLATASEIDIPWDGRDNAGRICDGGIYIGAFDVEFTSGGSRQRATRRAGVSVVR